MTSGEELESCYLIHDGLPCPLPMGILASDPDRFCPRRLQHLLKNLDKKDLMKINF